MAAFWRMLAFMLLCQGVAAKSRKRKRTTSSPSSLFDWSTLLRGLQDLWDSADLQFNESWGTWASSFNITRDSASEWTAALTEKLVMLWESELDERVIAPCERWYDSNPLQKGLSRHDLVAKAKSEHCRWNALTGAMAGAVPVPGLDALGSVAAGFVLQAQGACVIAKSRGYDVRDEETRSLMLWALTGEAGSEVAKKVVAEAARVGGTTAGKTAIKRLPNQFFKELNKKLWPLLGRHLVTKGPQGLLSLSKIVPVVGSVTGAAAGSAIDWFFCRQAIDYADQTVFRKVNKGEKDLKEYLLANDFEDEVVQPLLAAQFDMETICMAEKSDLKELGLPLGRILKLQKTLFEAGGLCTDGRQDEEL